LQSPDDLGRIYLAVAQAGTLEDQADILADLSLRAHLAKHQQLCQEIVEKKILPLVYALPSTDRYRRWALIRALAPAICAGTFATAKRLIAELPNPLRDEALVAAMWFVFLKVPPSDPYDAGPRSGYDISFEDVNRLIELAELMTSDINVYSVIRRIADSVASSSFKDNLKGQQKSIVARQLRALAEQKLPAPEFISHEGYLVAALAQVSRIDPAASPSIEVLAARARAIPNVADEAFVLATIGGAARSKERGPLIDEATAIADTIPLLADRIERYEVLAQEVSATPARAKELLRKAIQLSMQGEGETIEERRKSLINLAYRVDTSFASSLATSFDDDPAKKRIERQVATLQLRDGFAEKGKAEVRVEAGAERMLPRAAWMKLGALNAGRLSPVPNDRAGIMLRFAAMRPVSESYPVFAWFIENAVRRSKNVGTLREQVLPLFEACLRGAELALRAGARPSVAMQPTLTLRAGDVGTGGAVIRDGERENGLGLLRDWLRSSSPTRLWIAEPYFGLDSVV